MRSSTSSSDPGLPSNVHETRPGFVRLTAADRPGVAQPVPERDVPAQPWGRIWIGALLLGFALLAAWELHWRAFGARPDYRNSDGEWAIQRRRIDAGEGGKTVLTGASRLLFDVQLPAWERVTGERPIQLAMEGTTPLGVVEDLAADPAFTGRLVIGVAPDVFFSGFQYRGDLAGYTRRQAPSQRTGTWLSMHFIEPYFASYDPDFALAVVVRRQAWWPPRPGLPKVVRVRKLADHDADRNTHLWTKLVDDPAYREMARAFWAEKLGRPPRGMETMDAVREAADVQIDRAVNAIATLRARGVPVVFVRPPSVGPYYEWEEQYLPRSETWDRLLERTGAPGIYFTEHPQLQGYDLPEWSHISATDAVRFTEQLAPLVEAAFTKQARLARGASPGTSSTPRSD